MELTKAKILEVPSSPKIERVDVPEWGDGAHVFVREMCGDERDDWDTFCIDRGNNYRGFRAELISRTLCDKSGKLLGFTEAEVKQLGKKSGAAIDRIFQRSQELSKLLEQNIVDAKKNSPKTLTESSGSNSH